jgi:O-antigen/teichoic acid export membrane protein
MTLKKEMVRGIAWSIVERGGQQIISFFLFILIARLIGPEEYGLVMLSFIYLSFVSLLQLGMADSVVSMQLKDQDKLSTLFWIIVGCGILFSSLCFFLADVAAGALNEPSLEYLFKWLSIVSLLLSIQAVPHMLVMQSMNFKIYAVRTLIATIVSGVVGVYMAYNGFGALAMIFQQIVLYTISNIILWTFVDWRPHFSFNIRVVRVVIMPGYKMMLSNSLIFMEQQLPRLFLGDFLGPRKVAYFSFAFRMRYALQDILITPAFVVLFPALSKIKNNRDEQDQILGIVFFIIGFIVFPIVTLATLTAPLYVPLLFGDKWISAIQILQIFLILGIATPFISLASVIFRVNDKVHVYLRAQTFIVLLSLIVIYFLAKLSLLAVGWAIFSFTIFSVPFYFFFLSKWGGIKLWHHFSQLAVSILSTVVMAMSVLFFMGDTASKTSTWADFITTIMLGSLLYLILNFFLQRKKIMIILPSLKRLLQKKVGSE